MVLRKTKPHLSVTNGGEIEGPRVDVFQGKSTEAVDHWAFLVSLFSLRFLLLIIFLYLNVAFFVFDFDIFIYVLCV